jgi:hypothetical protein
MAINQVSLFFYPPRRAQRLTPDPRLLTSGGRPVQIADAVPSGADGQPSVGAGDVKAWLVEHEFADANWGRGWVLERGRIESIFGPEKEIQVNIAEEKGELTELYCRFTLPRRSRPPLSDWSSFVAGLCRRFRLRLGDDASVCDEGRFLAAVRGSDNYRDSASALGWEGRRAE